MNTEELIDIKTEEWESLINITDIVRDRVLKSGTQYGMVLIYCLHTTAGLRILENEQLLLKDIQNFLERQAPSTIHYLHDDLHKRMVPDHERINGHSHLKSLLLNTSEYVPITSGKLLLGTWQKIFFIECDPGRERKIFIKVVDDEAKHL